MKKVLRYLLMTVMAICFSIPCFGAAEAASVALLPLINNVEGGDELANQVFYKNALAVLNSKKGFVVVENDKLTAVIDVEASIYSRLPIDSNTSTKRDREYATLYEFDCDRDVSPVSMLKKQAEIP